MAAIPAYDSAQADITSTLQALSLSIDSDVPPDVDETADLYRDFGSVSSFARRAKFLRMTADYGFDSRENALVIMTVCRTRNKQKVLDHLAETAVAENNVAGYQRMLGFVTDKMVQRAGQAPHQGDCFAMVHLPSCFPGHDLLFWATFAPAHEVSFHSLLCRATASQLKLDDELQRWAKDGFDRSCSGHDGGYVQSPAEVQAREDYYHVLEADVHLLVRPEGDEVATETGYTVDDMVAWLEEVREFKVRRGC